MNHPNPKRFAAHSSRAVELDAQAAQLVAELRELREANRDLTAREHEVRERLLEVLDGADHGTVNGHPIIRAERVTQHRIDSRRLRDEFPDVADYCQRTIQFVALKLP